MTQTLELTTGHSFIKIPTGADPEHPEIQKNARVAASFEAMLDGVQEERRKLAGSSGPAAKEAREKLREQARTLREQLLSRGPDPEAFRAEWERELTVVNRVRYSESRRPEQERQEVEAGQLLRKLLESDPNDGEGLVMERGLEAARKNDIPTLRAITTAPESFPLLPPEKVQEIMEEHLRHHAPEKAHHLENWRKAVSAAEHNARVVDDLLRRTLGDETLPREPVIFAS